MLHTSSLRAQDILGVVAMVSQTHKDTLLMYAGPVELRHCKSKSYAEIISTSAYSNIFLIVMLLRVETPTFSLYVYVACFLVSRQEGTGWCGDPKSDLCARGMGHVDLAIFEQKRCVWADVNWRRCVSIKSFSPMEMKHSLGVDPQAVYRSSFAGHRQSL